MKSKSVKEHLKNKLRDPYFKEMYEIELQKLDIAKTIIAYRIKNNLNQKQLAERTGVSQQHISKIENGDFENMKTVEKVLLHLGKTIRITVIKLEQNSANRIKKFINLKRKTKIA